MTTTDGGILEEKEGRFGDFDLLSLYLCLEVQ